MSARDYSATPTANLSLNGIFVGPNMARSDVDNAIRQLMADTASSVFIKTAGGGLMVRGVASGEGLPRDDAGVVIIAPPSGHALQMFINDNATDECAIVFQMPDSALSYVQYATIFNALIGGSNSTASLVGFTGFHGVIHGGTDNTPLIVRYDNAIEVLGGTTGSTFWHNGYTNANVFHNFQNSYLQGWSVFGLHSQSVQSGNIAEFNGTVFIGAVDATTHVSTQGAVIAWHVATGRTLFQSFAYQTGTFQPAAVFASELTLCAAGQKIGFFDRAPQAKPNITGALSTVTDAAAKAVLTSVIDALKSTGAGVGLVADTTT